MEQKYMIGVVAVLLMWAGADEVEARSAKVSGMYVQPTYRSRGENVIRVNYNIQLNGLKGRSVTVMVQIYKRGGNAISGGYAKTSLKPRYSSSVFSNRDFRLVHSFFNRKLGRRSQRLRAKIIVKYRGRTIRQTGIDTAWFTWAGGSNSSSGGGGGGRHSARGDGSTSHRGSYRRPTTRRSGSGSTTSRVSRGSVPSRISRSLHRKAFRWAKIWTQGKYRFMNTWTIAFASGVSACKGNLYYYFKDYNQTRSLVRTSGTRKHFVHEGCAIFKGGKMHLVALASCRTTYADTSRCYTSAALKAALGYGAGCNLGATCKPVKLRKPLLMISTPYRISSHNIHIKQQGKWYKFHHFKSF